MPKGRGRRRYIFLVIGVVAAAWLAWYVLHGWTSARLERLVRAEVPPGCSRAEVEAFLDRHDIPHDYSTLGEVYADSARKAGLERRDLAGVVKGDIFPANEGWFFRSEIDVLFFFDKQGSLAGHAVEVWFDFL